jgi:acetoin utilization deacetylase AcuC-like enzyme
VPLTIFTSDRFADHLNPPGHPERVERAEVMQVVAAEFRKSGGTVLEPRSATEEELARVHDRDYLTMLRETAGRATALDPDTFTSPDSYEVARLAAGAAVSAVDHVLAGAAGTRALVLARPPGHHAERNRAMGFCLFNNVAVAAAHARARGRARVAIVDYDVHHGNGTQWSFYDDPSVLFVSSHQYPFYPGTGAAGDVGTAKGLGFTVNLPVEAGGTDADFERLYSGLVTAVLRQYKPELILLSAGYDAHADDPLGGMRLSTAQFGRLTAIIAASADECCGGRVVALSEGGYDLNALAGSLRATIRVLRGEASLDGFAAPAGPTPRADATLNAVRPHLAKFWQI